MNINNNRLIARQSLSLREIRSLNLEDTTNFIKDKLVFLMSKEIYKKVDIKSDKKDVEDRIDYYMECFVFTFEELKSFIGDIGYNYQILKEKENEIKTLEMKIKILQDRVQDQRFIEGRGY